MTTAVRTRPLDRLPVWVKLLLVAFGVAAFLAILAVLPLPLPPYLDFQVLYQADMGLLRGVALYDHAGQVNMIAQLAHVTTAQVYVLPFPYPPWYALSTLWLALMPIQAAARVWFGIGLALLIASLWLLTEDWQPLKRLLAIVVSVFFLPVLGSLLVGQYVFPVLAGCALMMYALRHERPGLTALAAALLTFKPHLGGLVLLAVLLHLWLRGDAFSRRARLAVAATGVALFCLGFLADGAWPLDYLRSLLGFRQDSGVAGCGLCASLPALLTAAFSKSGGLSAALVTGILLLVAMLALWLATRRRAIAAAPWLIAFAVLFTLLASPYLLNYDFVLLLIPLTLLAGTKHGPDGWLMLALFYLLPFAALFLPGKQGNFFFPLCALALLVLIYRATRPLDGSSSEAYNLSTTE